jgi:tripartite-type tricarboxylate transporter receptor subunit TctC
MKRRTFLHLAAGAATVPGLARLARAQTYPTRPVHLLVGYAAGGPTDISARLAGQLLSERLGQPFVIENRPGAGSNLATELVVHAQPDGHTLLTVTSSNAWNVALYDKPGFDFLRDIVPIGAIMRTTNVMEVHPSVPATTVPEFIAYAKANPGKINMAAGGVGSSPHLCGELFKAMTGVDLVTVQYRGAAPALPDLIAGQVQVTFDSLPSSIGQIRAGRLRPLGVTSALRSPALPEVPPIGDFVKGYEAGGWQGLGAPRNTPIEVIERLNTALNDGLADPEVAMRIADLGGEPFATSPAGLGKYIADFTEKWAKVIRVAGIKGE